MSIPVVIEQTTNKHTRAYYKNKTIVIRLAKGLSSAQKKSHTEQLIQRMSKRIQLQPERTIIQPFAHITTTQVSYIPLTNNATFAVHLYAGAKNYTKVPKPYEVHITNANLSPKQLQAKLWKLLSKASAEYFANEITTMNAQTYKVTVRNVRIGHRTSAWGSMSSTGTLQLNPALLFVPKHLRDYVLLHELAHGIEQNHSSKFWKQVERFLPNYKQCVKELKQYALQ